ncbi:hypothetical protein [Streptomyces sp. NPDC007172]
MLENRLEVTPAGEDGWPVKRPQVGKWALDCKHMEHSGDGEDGR